ncbi:hypothetical protein A8708_10640 [Paenibacillus oryzisoli]|uniref:Transposase IS4-like domain-containing protein n=1 Tax=Paenibacillus oryzisoli TaxID=1850517 RepID=A0A197ZWQ4_9BACL|nr:hypothetical protein A8708_10640 [Paenibacillus oryzisoli]
MAVTLPIPPYGGYALVDSWFTCARVIDSYAAAGYHLIGGLKTNRIIYPQGIRISIQDFAAHMYKEDIRLVTVNETSYWTYRYEGALNDIENAVVLLCWPEQAFDELFYAPMPLWIRKRFRLWALLAWTHLYCTTGLGQLCPFGDGLRAVRKQVQLDRLQFVYDCGQKGIRSILFMRGLN